MIDIHRSKLVSSIFSDITDPRSPRNSQHLLLELIIITICAVICGAEGWEDIETFAKQREAWLRGYLTLPYGVPCHDTFRRVFSRINPEELQSCFRRWVRAVFHFTGKQVIAIDGKSLRRSFEDGNEKHKGMIHMVSAWAAENELILGQIKTKEKSNEINAIPELLSLLAIEGCIITIDAMGCQKKIAEQIITQKGDYVLAVKENQGTLYEAINTTFQQAQNLQFKNMVYDYCEEIDSGHGRIETRKCTVLPLMYLHQFKLKWRGLQSLILIESRREVNDQSQIEQRYYISSLPMNARLLMTSVRQHWGIENRLHWVLDVVFREDDSRIRKDYGAENFAVVRHIALNLLKQEHSNKFSIKKKRYVATLNPQYLEQILRGA